MIRVLTSLKLKRDFDRVKVYTTVHLSLIVLAHVVELFKTGFGLSLLIEYAYLGFIYVMFWRTLKGLYYTFWTIIGLLAIYSLSGVFDGFSTLGSPFIGYCYILSIIFLAIQAYTMMSPIYYPVVNWWEYDFRFRDDVKVKCETSSVCFEGRINDLRRGAGCLTAFHSLKIGDRVKVSISSHSGPVQLEAEIMSQRLYSLGRPFNYGVRFHFSSEADRSSFESFCLYWRSMRSSLKQMKFKKSHT